MGTDSIHLERLLSTKRLKWNALRLDNFPGLLNCWLWEPKEGILEGKKKREHIERSEENKELRASLNGPIFIIGRSKIINPSLGPINAQPSVQKKKSVGVPRSLERTTRKFGRRKIYL